MSTNTPKIKLSELGQYLTNLNQKKANLVIKTDHVFPPIPIRSFDWVAWVDGEEDNGCYGHGKTEQEARDDLINNYDA